MYIHFPLHLAFSPNDEANSHKRYIGIVGKLPQFRSQGAT